jgi:hypothetical protein
LNQAAGELEKLATMMQRGTPAYYAPRVAAAVRRLMEPIANGDYNPAFDDFITNGEYNGHA